MHLRSLEEAECFDLYIMVINFLAHQNPDEFVGQALKQKWKFYMTCRLESNLNRMSNLLSEKYSKILFIPYSSTRAYNVQELYYVFVLESEMEAHENSISF